LIGELRPLTFSVNIERYVVIPAIFFALGGCVCIVDSLLLYNCLPASILRFKYSLFCVYVYLHLLYIRFI
jgi:hypothetical protein